MEFCVLSPVSGLERYAALGRTHLLLPHLDKVPGYREFYFRMRERGDILILDNGAYEGKNDWKSLVDCIAIYQPHIVALPDFYLQPYEKTVWKAQSFLDSYFYAFPQVEWMFIPQSTPNNIIGWVEGLELIMRDERVSWVGLPRNLTYAITQDLYMRVQCAKVIHDIWPHIKLHALGMAKGSIKELNALNGLGCVSSIDSNAPVWRGWNRIRMYGEDEPRDCPPTDYEAKWINDDDEGGWAVSTQEIIMRNLEVCGVHTTYFGQRNFPQRETSFGG